MMYISTGDRQKFTPAQDLGQSLGKILRLTDSGGVPRDNPFAAQGGVAAQVWTLGHRNPLGIAFDSAGRLWEQEMGPKGGDEVNLIVKGRNYGYPNVSNGDHYDGKPIPDHSPRDGFEAPKVSWNPAISPGGLMIYSGNLFPQWRGSAFIGGLSSEALVRVALNGDRAAKGDQFPMGARIREVEQGPDGAIYVLEDGEGGRLLRLTPA
jgi:glucose/arabinose dehydrogenase